MIDQTQGIGGQPPTHSSGGVDVPEPPPRAVKILLGGGIGAYIIYWLQLRQTGVMPQFPHILSGVVGAAIVEMALLVKDLALHILGNRQEYEHLTQLGEASALDWLRYHTWKVVSRVEKLEEDMDVIFSRVFNIRTAKEIRQRYSTDHEFYLADPGLMEVIRQVFSEHVGETIKIVTMFEMGAYVVEAMGYTVLGSHFLSIGRCGLIFFSGLIVKAYGKGPEAKSKNEQQQPQDPPALNRDGSSVIGAGCKL